MNEIVEVFIDAMGQFHIRSVQNVLYTSYLKLFKQNCKECLEIKNCIPGFREGKWNFPMGREGKFEGGIPRKCGKRESPGVSGNSRSRSFPRIEASDSRSRTLGMDFFIPFPFPNFGNGFF